MVGKLEVFLCRQARHNGLRSRQNSQRTLQKVINSVDLSVKCRNLGRASPCNQRSTVKYSCTMGGFNRSIFKDLGINSALITNKLVGAGNASLAQSTWKRYGALHSHIKFAESLSGVKLTFPFSTKSVLILVGAMLVKELQPSTIEVHLSALKAWQVYCTSNITNILSQYYSSGRKKQVVPIKGTYGQKCHYTSRYAAH